MKRETVSTILLSENPEPMLKIARKGNPSYQLFYQKAAGVYWDEKEQGFESTPIRERTISTLFGKFNMRNLLFFTVFVFSTLNVAGQASNCNSLFLAPEYCNLMLIEQKMDTIKAIIDSTGCWIDETKCGDGYWYVYTRDTSIILKEFLISDGLLDGIYSERFENGNLRTRQAYKEGKPLGSTLHFDQNGHISLVGVEDSSRFIGSQFWYWDNGMLAKCSTWTEQTDWYNPISLYWDFDGNIITEETWELMWNCN